MMKRIARRTITGLAYWLFSLVGLRPLVGPAIPPEVMARALKLVLVTKYNSMPDVSDELRRHQVYAKLIKEFREGRPPKERVRKRILAMAIEVVVCTTLLE